MKAATVHPPLPHFPVTAANRIFIVAPDRYMTAQDAKYTAWPLMCYFRGMTGDEMIQDYVKKFVQLTPAESVAFAAAFKEVRVKKKQWLVQPGFIAKSRYFVLKGALRAYVINEQGQDNTVQLAVEQWWISDYNSYMLQQPASMFVVAMEDSTLLQVQFEDEMRLKAANYKYETFFRMMAEKAAAFMQRRVITGLTLSAEQRYDSFTAQYPLMTNRFPQYVIASYLGMTTEFLSKIRNHKLKKS